MIFFGLFLLVAEIKNSLSAHEHPSDDEPKALNLFQNKHHYPLSYHRKSLLFVSTVDGKLTCLNAKSGEFLWAFDQKEPLLSSSISSVKVGADLSKANFIPSLDGTLYKWNGRYVESLSLSTDFLLGQMKKLPDGKFVVGGTSVVLYGIDIQTGKILYESSGRGCKSSGAGMANKDILSLRKSKHIVRAVDRITGHETWNYSVGKYDMELAESNLDLQINTPSMDESADLHFLVRDGIISNTATSWSMTLKSPITDVWRLDNDSLKPVDIFRHGLFENTEGLPNMDLSAESYMFLGIHDGQLYIQKPTGYNNGRKQTVKKNSPNELDVSSWRPFISTSASRTPTLNNKLTSLSSLDYPFDNGFVLVSNNSPAAISILSPFEQDEVEIEFCEGEGCDEFDDTDMPFIENVPLTFKDWWKEILVLSIVIAVGINIGLKILNKKLLKRPKKRKSSNETSDTLTQRSQNIEDEKPTAQLNMLETFSRTHTSSVCYDSRYIDDFEHVEVLGQGGFGVVFKAKKRIDDCEYAIKRIYLPHCNEAKSKMMREVKALANLDHVGIVRYFHAWWEEPPSDWQKSTDKALFRQDSFYSNSFGLSQDWVLEVDDVSENHPDLLTAPTRTEKRSSDDPLGKRYNFDTGIEEIISDHKEFDLLKHNDVFFEDNESRDITESGNDSQVDDSFIIFESNYDSNDQSSSYAIMDEESDSLLKSNTNSIDLKKDDCSVSDIDHTFNSIKSKTRTKKKLVGKCCAQSALCLERPPLFLYIQMQLCKTKTLKDYLKEQTDKMPLSESMAIFMQIVNAVEYFHHNKLMHRDLKPANILFSKTDNTVKIGDFGLVTAITQPSVGKHQGKSIYDENHTGQVGTQLYMSPEQAIGKPYNHKIDIYSLGLILFELISAFSTQMERMQLIYKLRQGILADELLSTPQGKLVQILTAENPNLRPEANEIKEHEYIKDINDITNKNILSIDASIT